MNSEPSPSPVESGRGGFLLNVNLVFFAQLAAYGLAFLLRVVLARGLGDEGLGTYSLFFLTAFMTGMLASMGVGLGNIYFLNKGTYPLRDLLRSSLFAILTAALLVTAVVVALGLLFEPRAFVSGRGYWLYAPAVAGIAGFLILTSLLHGAARFLAFSGVRLAQGTTALTLAALLLFIDRLDLFSALTVWVSALLAANLLSLALIGWQRLSLREILRPPWQALRDQVKFGLQGQASNFAQLINYRLDLFLVAAFVSRAAVGHYAVATAMSESVWWLSSAVAMVLLPRLTRMEREEAGDLTPVICRNTLLVSALTAALLAAASPILIRVLFGSEFAPAVKALVLLMPGVIAISGTRILSSYLFSQGKVILNTYTTLIALAATLLLDLALIPVWEIAGAAVASSTAYTLSLLVTLWWYRRLSGNKLGETLIWQTKDIQLYTNAVRRLRRRLMPAGKPACR